MTALLPELAAEDLELAAEPGPVFIAMCEELVFFTGVCGMSVEDAARRLGRSERVVARYRAYLRENRHIRRRVLRRYRACR